MYAKPPSLRLPLSDLGVEANPGPGEDPFCWAGRRMADVMGQESGKKWTAAADLRPAPPKADRLLTRHRNAFAAFGGLPRLRTVIGQSPAGLPSRPS